MVIGYRFSQSIEYCFAEHIMYEMRSLLPKGFKWNCDENQDILGFYYEEEENENKYVEDNIRHLIKGIYQEYSQLYGYNTTIFRIFLEKN